MKSKLLLLGAAGLCVVAVVACHDDNHSAPPAAATAQPQALDTAQVLAMAQKTSETSAPIPVDNGGVTLTDTSETSAPIAATSM